METNKCWGFSTHIDAHHCALDRINNKENIQKFIDEVVMKLEMKKYGDSNIVLFGDDPAVYGYSFTQLIETSLVSGHFAEEKRSAYIDVFSCKYYNPEILNNLVVYYFEASEFEIRHLERR